MLYLMSIVLSFVLECLLALDTFKCIVFSDNHMRHILKKILISITLVLYLLMAFVKLRIHDQFDIITWGCSILSLSEIVLIVAGRSYAYMRSTFLIISQFTTHSWCCIINILFLRWLDFSCSKSWFNLLILI